MQLGMIGLGRMGGNLVRRLSRQGHQCIVFDENPAAVAALSGENVKGAGDLADVAEVWRRGSVVSSWLLDLTASALAKDPALNGYSGFVEDSGEGRWTINTAIEEAVPADVLSAALYARFRSRDKEGTANKLLSAMRHAFGGHLEPKKA